MTTASSDPDIDAEFERVGGDDSADLAVAEFAFNLAALARQVSAAVATYGVTLVTAFEGVLSSTSPALRWRADVGKDQCLLIALDEFEGDAPRLMQIAAADAELPINDGGL